MFVHAVTVCKISREFGVSTPSIPQWWFYSFFLTLWFYARHFQTKPPFTPYSLTPLRLVGLNDKKKEEKIARRKDSNAPQLFSYSLEPVRDSRKRRSFSRARLVGVWILGHGRWDRTGKWMNV